MRSPLLNSHLYWKVTFFLSYQLNHIISPLFLCPKGDLLIQVWLQLASVKPMEWVCIVHWCDTRPIMVLTLTSFVTFWQINFNFYINIYMLIHVFIQETHKHHQCLIKRTFKGNLLQYKYACTKQIWSQRFIDIALIPIALTPPPSFHIFQCLVCWCMQFENSSWHE